MPWRLEKKAERISKYYDRSQPRKCCSSLSLRNRKCWIWNLYFRCSRHYRVYRINWYNAKKISWNHNDSEVWTGNAGSGTTSGKATAESTVKIDTTTQKNLVKSQWFRGLNRKCWIWNYFRWSHCRVYRINWYNNAKKNLVKLQRLVNIRIDSKLSSLRGGNLKCWIWRHYRINWYNKNADVVSSELFIFGKEKKKLVKSPQGKNSSQDFSEKNQKRKKRQHTLLLFVRCFCISS